MAKNKLTDLKYRNLKAGDGDKNVPDGDGLYIRVRSKKAGGGVSFRYRSFVGGQQRWITLKATTLAKARDERDTLKKQAWDGIDLLAEKKLDKERKKLELQEEQAAIQQRQAELAKQQAELEALITVNDLFDRWANIVLKDRKDGGAEVRRMFNKDVLPVLGGMAVADVRKSHITGITDALLLRGVNRMAKLILSLIRQMFRFAVDRDIIEFDPSASIRKAKIGGKSVERDRTLKAREIRDLHRQLPTANLIPSTEAAIWIMLSTLCRVGELSKARWEHVDLDAGIWTIPIENSKNEKPHTINLSRFANQQFKRLAQFRASDDWLFPNRDNSNHVSEKSISKQINGRQNPVILNNRTKHNTALVLSGGNWTPHDLRRTGATLMGDLGVAENVIEKCLNHTEQDKLKRVYQRQKLEAEQAAAWRLLGERLELLTSDAADNVVLLRKTH